MFSVQADSEDEAREALARLCAALGLRPIAGGKAMQSLGRDRWLARAEPERPEQPAS
jgi:hypothetical protein